MTEITKPPGTETLRPRAGLADLSAHMFGKLPPQARDLEEAVLGAMMLDKNAVATVLEVLKPESFYVDAHQSIMRAVMNLFERSKPVDLLTVTEELRAMGELEAVGGPFFVTELTNIVASSANVEYHARVIAEKYIQRELIKVSSEIIKDAYNDTVDVLDLLDKAEQNLFNITEGSLRKTTDPMSTLLHKAVKEIEELQVRDTKLRGVPSGFGQLDRLTGGWQKSDLIIVASRPGMGKTSFTLAVARNAAVTWKMPVAIFSLEMSSTQLVQRLMSSETEIPSEQLRQGRLTQQDWDHLIPRIHTLSDAPIFIDDTAALNMFELRAKCRRLKMQYDVQLFIVDYLQLMHVGSDTRATNREQEISQISRSLKGIAKEMEVPVIALSQLSRAVEVRGGLKRPQLSDLRESGAIEQDADLVLFLWRPEYYGITEDNEGGSLEGLAEVNLAKHRNGPTGAVMLKFINKFAKFVPIEGEMPDLSEKKPTTVTRGSKMNRDNPFLS